MRRGSADQVATLVGIARSGRGDRIDRACVSEERDDPILGDPLQVVRGDAAGREPRRRGDPSSSVDAVVRAIRSWLT
jgi:hypothetical protein